MARNRICVLLDRQILKITLKVHVSEGKSRSRENGRWNQHLEGKEISHKNSPNSHVFPLSQQTCSIQPSFHSFPGHLRPVLRVVGLRVNSEWIRVWWTEWGYRKWLNDWWCPIVKHKSAQASKFGTVRRRHFTAASNTGSLLLQRCWGKHGGPEPRQIDTIWQAWSVLSTRRRVMVAACWKSCPRSQEVPPFSWKATRSLLCNYSQQLSTVTYSIYSSQNLRYFGHKDEYGWT